MTARSKWHSQARVPVLPAFALLVHGVARSLHDDGRVDDGQPAAGDGNHGNPLANPLGNLGNPLESNISYIGELNPGMAMERLRRKE